MTELGRWRADRAADHAGRRGEVADRMAPRCAAGAANGNAARTRKAPPLKGRASEPANYRDIAEQAARLGITVERVLVEYARIAFADIRQVLTWGPDGIVLKPPDGLGDAEAAAICEIAPARGPAPIKSSCTTRKPRWTRLRAISACFRQRRDGARRLLQPIWRRTRVKCLHAGWLASLQEILRHELVRSLTQDQAVAILNDWRFWARPNQLPP